MHALRKAMTAARAACNAATTNGQNGDSEDNAAAALLPEPHPGLAAAALPVDGAAAPQSASGCARLAVTGVARPVVPPTAANVARAVAPPTAVVPARGAPQSAAACSVETLPSEEHGLATASAMDAQIATSRGRCCMQITATPSRREAQQAHNAGAALLGDLVQGTGDQNVMPNAGGSAVVASVRQSSRGRKIKRRRLPGQQEEEGQSGCTSAFKCVHRSAGAAGR
jgi:hypothetical protein